ncbi:MAG: hypothetical protein GW903_09065 [Alphaproteobacteria bacterium]|nr:hypothetical protein [Alphaproteobacteria bacterium]NCQ89102.1 hypothetical protein [Alphaproteobacteria bacterium]NCT08002.1 hypothetical protein [Alphaproteobacteria bacterium]
MNTDYDPFEEPRAPVRGKRSPTTGRPLQRRFSAKTAFLAVMIAVGILIGAIWSLYPSGKDAQYAQNVPIVRAESKPLKYIPEDTGGMDIAHRDSTVFSGMGNEDDSPRIENLLADNDTEEPLPRSQLFAGLNTDEDLESGDGVTQEQSDEEMGNDLIVQEQSQAVLTQIERPERVIPFEQETPLNNVEETIEDIAEDIDSAGDEPAPSEVIMPVEPMKKPVQEKVADVKPVLKERKLNEVVDTVLDDENKIVAKPAPVEPAPEQVQAAPSGSHYVQLASVKTRMAAESEWTSLRAKYNLSSSYRIQTKDLGDKGVFHRIQAGPYSKTTADKICADIKAKTPGGCLVTQ